MTNIQLKTVLFIGGDNWMKQNSRGHLTLNIHNKMLETLEVITVKSSGEILYRFRNLVCTKTKPYNILVLSKQEAKQVIDVSR